MYKLRLYVAGQTAKSMKAIADLKAALAAKCEGPYSLRVCDLLKDPRAAEDARVFATPTAEKRTPPPVRRIIGDLSNSEKVLAGLGLILKSANY